MAGQRSVRGRYDRMPDEQYYSRERRDRLPDERYYRDERRDPTPRTYRPVSRAGAARRFAAEWSARLSAVRPSVRQRARSSARPPARPSGRHGAPYGSSAPRAHGQTPRRRTVLLRRWGLILLIALIVLGSVGGIFYKLSHAAEDAASQLCTDVTAGHYDAAYDLLSASLQMQVPRKDFTRIGPALDTLDGRITTCTATSYDYALGSGQASLSAHITRADGQTFNGQVEMRDENGWKVAVLDPHLSGASLGALDVALRFCDALRAGDGGTLLSLSSGNASAGLGDAQQLAATLNTWQQVDGAVTGCALAGANGTGASDAAAQVTLGITRARRGTAVAALGLADGAQGWRVTAIGANLLGSDLGPLAVGQRFCTALAAGNFAAAYALFSPSYAAQVSLDQFTAAFAPLGSRWTCAPRLDTYAVSGATGSYDVALTLSGAGQPLAMTATLRFSVANGAWAIQDVEPHG